MNMIHQPSSIIPAALSEQLRHFSAKAEEKRKLQAGQLNIIYKHRWFNIWVPRACGGLELSLPEGLRLQEALAWTDGSLGWTITLCSGANWFVGFLQPDATKKLFKDKKVCFA